MSYSRLEKFIYAICSMDVTDLPVPLSRIEILWNCLITGETPDFEPLSRNEKYLMAMLDRYDISNLPAPMSRGEKLLYKIAVGETDLSDVPGYLSRYEELLKYLIENGGISGGDFEYVLYTLNQSLHTLYTTAEKPVKSAILKGQTLVNVYKITTSTPYTYKAGSNPSSKLIVNLSANKTYLIILDFSTVDKDGKEKLEFFPVSTFIDETKKQESNFSIDKNGRFTYKYTPSKDVKKYTIVMGQNNFESNNPTVVLENAMIIEYQQGMENWDIPYFEGMQSVKMPVLTTVGKNLVKIKQNYSFTKNGITFSRIDDNAIKVVGELSQSGISAYLCDIDLSKTFENGKKYTALLFDSNGNVISNSNSGTLFAKFNITKHDGTHIYTDTFTFDSSIHKEVLYYISTFIGTGTVDLVANVFVSQFDEQSTTYEPYKSNILTVNEDVELRGIGDVKDELNLITGELTQRVGEAVLDGSEDEGWRFQSINEYGIANFLTTLPFKDSPKILCDSLVEQKTPIAQTVSEGVYMQNSQSVYIRISSSKANTTELFKKYLQSNPITIQYELKTESIKTVDLTVVNQDNQPTQLGTFENVTHVSLEAENLIPEVEMEVATNLLEDTVFNLTNAFNTLYPTAAKPVKSAILKGQTLVNLVKPHKTLETYYKVGISTSFQQKDISLIRPLEPSKTYTIQMNITRTNGNMAFQSIVIGKGSSDADSWSYRLYTGGFTNQTKKLGITKCLFTTPSAISETNYDNIKFISEFYDIDAAIEDIMIIEGDYTNVDIPYFEGMQSVKMPVLKTTGKNLFDINDNFELGYIDKTGEISLTNRSNSFERKNNGFSVNVTSSYGGVVSSYITVKPNTSYKINFNKIGSFTTHANIIFFDNNKNAIENITDNRLVNSFTTPSSCSYLKIGFWLYNAPNTIVYENIQLEEGTQATTYEPFKSNILSTPEDLVLRKVGTVQDELDCLTGEVVERIGEIVLDGSQNIFYEDAYNRFYIELNSLKKSQNYLSLMVNNVGHITPTHLLDFDGDIVISGHVDTLNRYPNRNWLYFKIKDVDSISVMKTYLSSNPITVQYALASESIKTVNLTVQDQNGNETKLGTFDDTTHALLNSEGLIPTAELTVRTKIPSASSTSLLMDDISTKQEQLETTVDEQSENVDATMIATTEIFEETL